MKLNFFRWPTLSTAPKPSNFCLLFLHGLGGTGQIWRSIAATLENEWDCLAPDQRGHGGSRAVPVNENKSFQSVDYAKDIAELLADLEIDKCLVIGHSMGVRTAFALTQLVPEKIVGLVAIDLGLSSQWGGGMGIALSHFIEKLPESFPTRHELKIYLTENCPDPAIGLYLGAVAKQTADGTWGFPFEHSSLISTIEQAHLSPLKEWVLKAKGNSIPLLFLHGKNSKVWSISDYEAQKAELECSMIHFESWEDAGHGLPFEQRSRFIERVKSFAKDITQ